MTELSREDLGYDFQLGVATSAYQIEGAAAQDGRGPSIWDVFSKTPGKTKSGHTGDIACDHYNRMPSDVALMAWLGVDAYRFSIAWPRVIPNGRGAVNERGLDFYDRLVDTLLAHGIAPCATLYHWDLPAALKGGWLARDVSDAFAEYAAVVAGRLGDRVQTWLTHNEPWCQAFLGYQTGYFAPGHKSLKEALLCAHNILLSHGKAVRVLREAVRGRVGAALNFMPIHPSTDTEADAQAATRMDGYFNRWFLEPILGLGYPSDMTALYGASMPKLEPGDLDVISTPTDVLGINYYERAIVADSTDGILRLKTVKREGMPRTNDREIYPLGLLELLQRLHSEYAVGHMLVTENGAAFTDEVSPDGQVDDQARVDFLRAHLEQVRAARALGIPVEGYFAWSLMDNFEWAEGYGLRYGLVHVDYDTQLRTPKASAHFLRSLARTPRSLGQR
jgi:beta-glucosidase